MANVLSASFGSEVADPADTGRSRTLTADLKAATGSMVSRLLLEGAVGMSPV